VDIGVPGRGGIAGGEVDGALVDVRGQDGRARGGVGQGQSDRPPPAAQVQQEAGLGRSGTRSRRTCVPLSRRSAEKTPDAVVTVCRVPRMTKECSRSSAGPAGEAVK